MSKARHALSTLIAVAAVVVAHRAPGQTGAEVFDSACAACHGNDGRGRSRVELGFETPLPDFSDCDFASREPDADWSAIIHEGGPVRGFDRLMPAFGTALSDAEIERVLFHVRTFCSDADWPRGDLNMPRAMFTEKAYPEDEAVVESTLNTVGDDTLELKFIWEQRFGTRNQVELSLPLVREHGAQGWASGAGDLGVGVKHVLRHSAARGSILSVGGELVLPTGDDVQGFGNGTTVLEPFLSFGKLLARDSFIQLQAKAEFPAAAALEDELAISAAYGRSFASAGPYGRAWTPIVELLGKRELESGATTSWDLVPQLQVSLNRRQHVLASAGLRVPANQRDARDVELVMYLLWDWYDGGVLEGW